MIIVQLKGGLGNQLFQYAAALSLAIHHTVLVKVDVSELKMPDEEIGTMRNYELQHLISPPELASQHEIKRFTQQSFFLKYFQKLLPPYKRKIYKESSLRFDPHFFSSGKNIYLKGYRQSQKYFLPIERIVRDQLKLNPALLEHVKEFGEAIASKNSISIHIRRGDYTDPAVLEYHGQLSLAYYQKAIEKISTLVEDPVFYIFSDDPQQAKQNFSHLRNMNIVSGTISKTHYEDLYLMSCCKHNIIANSSFSWWAAWLNNNAEKKVIAPLKWFDKANLDTSDLIPDNWIRI